MPKLFDAELNVLTEGHADEWGAYLCPRAGVPLGPLVALDTDLATTLQADRLWRVDGPVPAVLHVEFESTGRLGRPAELHRYNVQTHYSTGLPVHTVVLLLRPTADASDLTGYHAVPGADGEPYMTFKYRVVRLWQESMAALLAAGPGMAPLAPLTNEASADLSGAFDRVLAELRAANLPGTLMIELITSSLLLAGMRYPTDVIDPINARLGMGINLEESSTYQLIFREGERRGEARGEARGALKKALDMLLLFGTNRFGSPPAAVETDLRAIADLERLDRVATRLPEAADWADLLTTE